MKIQLLKTIREVIQADSDPVRQALFDHLRRSNRIVRFVYGTHRILGGSFLSAALVFLFGVKSYATADTSLDEPHLPLIIAIHKNARQQTRKIASWLEPNQVACLQLDLAGVLRRSTLLRLAKGCFRIGDWRRVYRLVDRLNRRYDFLVSCRTASAIFCYVRAIEILKQHESSGVIVSSDSNPEPLAFTRAAEAIEIPTIFMSHAYPTPVSPPLRFTLSILEGQAALQQYQLKGPVQGDVIFCGAEGASKTMEAHRLLNKRPVIGIFASKVVCWPQFIRLVEDCRNHFNPSKILIRWHPNMLGRSELSSKLSDTNNVVETASSLSLQDVTRECDWVITDENSNVNLGVLKTGVPVLPMKEFSVLPESRADLYGFVKSSILPKPVKNVREVSLEQLAEFYSDDWTQRFGSYDASYFQPAEELSIQARDAIGRVLWSSEARTSK